MMKLKPQHFGHLMQRVDCLEKTLMLEKIEAEGQGDNRDWAGQIVFEHILGEGEGQGSLACCSPWCRKESDTTERLNWLGKGVLMEFQEFIFLPLIIYLKDDTDFFLND